MILVRNLRLDIGQSSDRLKVKAARELKLPTWAIKDVKITKRSLDARRKNDIHWVKLTACTEVFDLFSARFGIGAALEHNRL